MVTGAQRTLRLFVALASLGAGCGAESSVDRLGQPILLTPAQGEGTGSVWSYRSLEPLFRWGAVEGATHYVIQIDDSCQDETCDFPSPEDQGQPRYNVWRPSALPVSMAPPVGRRYLWRVKACAASACGDFSRPRVVYIGRQKQDFNGDGYADVVVAAASMGPAGGVFVYFGGADQAAEPGWTFRSSEATDLFSDAKWVGDMDGDGFADLAVIHSSVTALIPSASSVQVFRGGQTPATQAAYSITRAGSYLLRALAAVPDRNGDGLSDLYFARTDLDVHGHRADEIVLGAPSLAADPTSQIPTVRDDAEGFVVGACDFDSDGYTDLIRDFTASKRGMQVAYGDSQGGVGPSTGGPRKSLVRTADGYALLACVPDFGGTGRAALLLSGVRTPASGGARFRIQESSDTPGAVGPCDGYLPQVIGGVDRTQAVATVGDVDGDGYSDLLVGDSGGDHNRAVLFFGGCPAGRLLELPGRSSQPNAGAGGFGLDAQPVTGFAVGGGGDVNGDGFPDLVVGNPGLTSDSFGTGEVYLYIGGVGVHEQPTTTIVHPDHMGGQGQDGFGASVD